MRNITDQELFWKGEFGDDYIQRNRSEELLASNLNFFSKAFKLVARPSSLVEFGANVGLNLIAIKALYPSINVHGVEINSTAALGLSQAIGSENVSNCSIFDFSSSTIFDVTLIKGVLIHINPENLNLVYEKLYNHSRRYILLCEYYNPVPVSVPYRGHSDRLYKRDFAGELLDRYSNLNLIDYGFVYRRDVAFPQDDITWFLMEKK